MCVKKFTQAIYISKALSFFVLIFCLFSAHVIAAEQDQIQQYLEQQNQDLELKNQIKEIEKNKKTRIEQQQKNSAKQYSDNGCITIKKISIIGNEVFKSKDILNKYLAIKTSDCVTKSELSQARVDLQNTYMEQGYSLARVYFDFKELAKNHLKFIISEGRSEEIILNDNSKLNEKLKFRRKFQLATAFPNKLGKVFNLKDIEQGLEQMNALASNNATMQIEPGKQEGYSKVNITNEITRPTSISLSHDNLGSETTGRTRRNLEISQDNLLSLNDNLFLNFSKDNEENQDEKFSFSNYGKLAIPLGYLSLSTSYSHSKYKLTTRGDSQTIISTGQTISKNISLERLIKKTKKYKLDLGLKLASKETKNFNSGIMLDDRKLVILEPYAKFLYYLPNKKYLKSGYIFSNFTYHRGMHWFNATKDEDLGFSEPHAQFDKFSLTNYAKANLKIADKNIAYINNTQLQLSLDELYGTEQISIGGNYSIRGFDQTSLAGDSGFHIRNDLEINPAEFIKFKEFERFIHRTKIAAFYDYGMVRKRGGLDKDYMSGAGAYLTFNVAERNSKNPRDINAKLTYSQSLHSPAAVGKEDGETIYFEVKISL